jgi:hypothetical protein
MEIVFFVFKLVLKIQYIKMKNVTPLCLQRKDSVKKSDNIKAEKAI